MPFLRMILIRVATSVLTLALVSVIIFVAVQGLPGDAAGRVLGREATEESKERLRAELNLDAPIVARYLGWAGGLLQGDFGTSFASRRPVADTLLPRLMNTFSLAGLAFLIYVPLSIVVALLQSRRPDRRLDRGLSAVTIMILSTPDFVFATLLLFTFAVWLPLFPPIVQITAGMSWSAWLNALLLPATTLAVLSATYGTRLLRESLIEILRSDYARLAEFKGMTERRILIRHVLPNALIPWFNATALNIAFMIGGVVVVEKVFNFSGFGSMLVDALQLRDLPVVSAGVMIAAALFIVVNLAADLGAMIVNPRLRVQA